MDVYASSNLQLQEVSKVVYHSGGTKDLLSLGENFKLVKMILKWSVQLPKLNGNYWINT